MFTLPLANNCWITVFPYGMMSVYIQCKTLDDCLNFSKDICRWAEASTKWVWQEKETEKATKLAALSLNWFLQNQNIHLYFRCFSWCIECLKFRHQGIKTRICYQTCACLQNSKWWVRKFCTMHQMNEFASCTFKKNKKLDNIVDIKGHWSWTSWLTEQYCFFFSLQSTGLVSLTWYFLREKFISSYI